MAARRRYPEELRERAVKMVLEIRERDGKGNGELARVGRQLGVHPEALRLPPTVQNARTRWPQALRRDPDWSVRGCRHGGPAVSLPMNG
jgi:hypothetical protein